MELAVDYLANREAFEPDLQNIKQCVGTDNGIESKRSIECKQEKIVAEDSTIEGKGSLCSSENEPDEDMFEITAEDIDEFEEESDSDNKGEDDDCQLDQEYSESSEEEAEDTEPAECEETSETDDEDMFEITDDDIAEFEGESTDTESVNDETDEHLEYAEETQNKHVEKQSEIEQRINELRRKKEAARQHELARQSTVSQQELIRKEAVRQQEAARQNYIKQQESVRRQKEARCEGNRGQTGIAIDNQYVQPARTETGYAQSIDYASMDIDALYKEVRRFMQEHGVQRNVVDKKVLEEKFGAQNIRKLIIKSYLILIGKGVTVGR